MNGLPDVMPEGVQPPPAAFNFVAKTLVGCEYATTLRM